MSLPVYSKRRARKVGLACILLLAVQVKLYIRRRWRAVAFIIRFMR
jgi:hypothetical protein